MSAMTRDAERRIIASVEKVAEMVADGDDPDDAIVKVARSESLPAGHVSLVARAYNTGMTNGRREAATDVIEKAADFPLADAAAILERLFPAEVKTAAALRRETGVSVEYSRPPDWYREAQREQALEKMSSAVAAPLCDRQAPPLPSDPMLPMKQAYHACLDDDRAVQEARIVATREKLAFTSTLEALGDYFREPGNLVVADVRDNVVSLHGKEGAAVLDYVVGMRPALTKAASLRPYHSTVAHPEPYALVQRAIAQGRHLLAYEDAVDQLTKDAAAAREDRLAPFVAAPATTPGSLLDGLCSPASTVKRSSQVVGGLRQGIGYGLAGDLMHGLASKVRDSHAATEEKVLGEISSPAHEQRLRDIGSEAMLTDFMAHDPVIKGHDPYEVTDAFNQISQFAPRVAGQPMMMAALMRRSLQGNQQPFEVGEIAKNEKTIGEIHPHYIRPEPATHTQTLSLPGLKAEPKKEAPSAPR